MITFPWPCFSHDLARLGSADGIQRRLFLHASKAGVDERQDPGLDHFLQPLLCLALKGQLQRADGLKRPAADFA